MFIFVGRGGRIRIDLAYFELFLQHFLVSWHTASDCSCTCYWHFFRVWIYHGSIGSKKWGSPHHSFSSTMSPFINQTIGGLIILTDFWFPISLLANWLDLKKEQEDIFSSTQKTYILQIDRETAPGREWNTLEKRILSGKLPDETCRLPRVCSIRWIFDKETTESVPQKYSPTSCRRTTIGGKTPHGFRCLELAENMTTVAEDWCGKALVFFLQVGPCWKNQWTEGHEPSDFFEICVFFVSIHHRNHGGFETSIFFQSFRWWGWGDFQIPEMIDCWFWI